jgi:aspartate/methionine/tyrosine aminotransferase
MTVLENAGVAITPGRDFGAYRAGAHIRFAYTRSMEDLEQGVERLKQVLSSP